MAGQAGAVMTDALAQRMLAFGLATFLVLIGLAALIAAIEWYRRPTE